MTMNGIFLRRQNKVVVPIRGQKTPAPYLATINANIEPLGYTLSLKVIEALTKAGQSAAVEFHHELVAAVREMKGVKDYQPTYPNFPRQVMDASEAELYLNAIVQYFHDWVADLSGKSLISWKPRYDKEARSKLQDVVKLTVIDLGTDTDFQKMMVSLLSTNTSVSQQDKDDVRWFLNNGGFDHLPAKIPHKEMLALVGAIAIHNGIDVSSYFKTATDVLRLATAMSEGDISLAEPTKFRSYKRAERKALLSILEHCSEITEDMLLHKGKWIRLGERLHPGEYKFTRVNQAFDVIRNDKPFQTFNARVEMAVQNNAEEALKLLSTRPGMLARRLDQLLRLGTLEDNLVVNCFKKTAAEVSTPMLLQTMTHFANRKDGSDLRVFFPKGNVAKAQAIRNELPPIAANTCDELVKLCEDTLVERFSGLPPLGRCKIDNSLKECLVPFSQRSASRSLRTIVRGSKLPFGNGDTIRFFIWWKQRPDDRTDLDLSAAFFGEDWQFKSAIAYYNLKEADYQACHSGDQTSAPEGACEFIDLDIPSSLRNGGRYVVMSVKSFTRQTFDVLPECAAGWMIRQHPNSGEIFEPKTVVNRLDVSSATTSVIPMILDLQERKVVWADVGMKINPSRPNNVHHNLSTIGLFGKAFSELKKPKLYDLFALHIKARGELITNGKADRTFGLEDAFGIEKIMSEFMK
jgi:hypothetical protein